MNGIKVRVYKKVFKEIYVNERVKEIYFHEKLSLEEII